MQVQSQAAKLVIPTGAMARVESLPVSDSLAAERSFALRTRCSCRRSSTLQNPETLQRGSGALYYEESFRLPNKGRCEKCCCWDRRPRRAAPELVGRQETLRF